jgi:hypothetical protein
MAACVLCARYPLPALQLLSAQPSPASHCPTARGLTAVQAQRSIQTAMPTAPGAALPPPSAWRLLTPFTTCPPPPHPPHTSCELAIASNGCLCPMCLPHYPLPAHVVPLDHFIASNGCLCPVCPVPPACPAAVICPAKPSLPLSNGSWPNSCAGTAVGSNCNADCTWGGSASTKCLATGGWSTSITGQCADPPTNCTGTPTATIPGTAGGTSSWSASCPGTLVGQSCSADCAAVSDTKTATVACLATEDWSNTADGVCDI